MTSAGGSAASEWSDRWSEPGASASGRQQDRSGSSRGDYSGAGAAGGGVSGSGSSGIGSAGLGNQKSSEGPTGLTDERDIDEQSSSVKPSLGRPAGAGGSAGGLSESAGPASSTRLGGEQQDAQTRRNAGDSKERSRPDGGLASEAPGRPSGSPTPSPYTDPSSTTKVGSSGSGSSAFTGGVGSGPMKGGKK
jgi:hypothetical protein